MLSPRLSLTLAAIMLVAGAVHAQAPTTAPTEPSSQYGWLEGTITNSDGQAIHSDTYSNDGKHIKGIRQGGGEFDVQSDTQLGGLYSAKNLRPGVYDIVISKSYIGNVAYCPERIFGVVVKPGERTVLKIVMDQGDTYEEIGRPAVVSAPATNVTEELAKMQKQIDDLKQQVAALLKAVPTASTPAAATKP